MGSRRKKRSSTNDLPSIDLFLNPAREQELEQLKEKAKANYLWSFQSLNTSSYESVFELLWYSSNPCFDGFTSDTLHQKSLIKQCLYKGMEVNCSSIFKMAPTDRGMCCVLTLRKDSIFVENRFSKTVEKLQRQDAKYALDSGGIVTRIQKGILNL